MGPVGDNGWLEQIEQRLAEATDAYAPDMVLDSHGGSTSDLNLHLHDLLADPNPNVADVMADYVPRS